MTTKQKKKIDLTKIKKPSSLLEIALKDLDRQSKAKNSSVCMMVFLHKSHGRGCRACLAGAVMRFSLNKRMRPYSLTDGAGLGLDDFSGRTKAVLEGLSDTALGLTETLLQVFPTLTNEQNDVIMRNSVSAEFTRFADDPIAWRTWIERLVTDLKTAGA